MKFNCGAKELLLLGTVLALVVIGLPLYLKMTPDEVPPKPVAPELPSKAPSQALPSTPPSPPTLAPMDLELRRWQAAIRQHDAKGVLAAQSTFLAREEEYRGPLMKMAKEDAEPRIRAFCLAVLGRMKSPPPEEFWVERLEDANEYSRSNVLGVLEKIGTTACLPVVDRLASSDPVEAVRTAAGQAAKAVRSR